MINEPDPFIPPLFLPGGCCFSSLLHPRIGRHPVDLPGLAAVSREGLLEADRVGVERRDHETDEDGASVEVFLVVELAASVDESADGRLSQRSAAAVGEVETPLARPRVVEPKVQAFEVAVRAVGRQLDQIGAAVPDLAHGGDTLVFQPFAGS